MGTPDCKVRPMFCPVGACETMGRYENGKPGLVRFGTGRSQNWFFGGWQMDQKFIKGIVRQSGAHVFCDSDDPIEANDSLVTLHARSAGVKTILLPRRATVVDVFGKRVVARNADRFTFEATLHSSYLFYYGEDAEEFIERIRFGAGNHGVFRVALHARYPCPKAHGKRMPREESIAQVMAE